jgi:hypothetical protein
VVVFVEAHLVGEREVRQRGDGAHRDPHEQEPARAARSSGGFGSG